MKRQLDRLKCAVNAALTMGLALMFATPARGDVDICTTWAQLNAAVSNGRDAKLANDITAVDNPWQIAFKTSTIDLNGHNLCIAKSTRPCADSLPQIVPRRVLT